MFFFYFSQEIRNIMKPYFDVFFFSFSFYLYRLKKTLPMYGFFLQPRTPKNINIKEIDRRMIIEQRTKKLVQRTGTNLHTVIMRKAFTKRKKKQVFTQPCQTQPSRVIIVQRLEHRKAMIPKK
jgi:hypothetical protein